jgi:D-threo-aldose 1-dehydrogenase
MILNTVGKTSIQITPIGLGCAPLGNFYREIPEEEVQDLIQYVFQSGCNYLDTAPLYGYGVSETRVGKILKDMPCGSFVLSSKVGYQLTGEKKAAHDYSREGILKSLDGSIQRLQTSCIDIVFIHDPYKWFNEVLEVVFPTLAELRSQGAIKAIGVGMMEADILRRFAKEGDFDCFLLAGRYTLLDQSGLELLNECNTRKIGMVLGAIYNGGILATGTVPDAKYDYRPAPPEILDRTRRIEAVCSRYGVPLKVAALRFVMAHPAVSSVIVGAECVDEYREAYEATQVQVPTQLWEDLISDGLIRPDVPVPTSEGIS